jgi:DNA-directed RNA polymerase subunit RPC12/RpoP
MPDTKKPERCPHCGHTQTPSLSIRTHCQRCGRPLKDGRRYWPEPGTPRPQPTP